MCVEEIIPLAKDVILTIAAVVGAFVAVLGLNNWNRQLKGSTEYDLSRRILKSTYRYRDAIKRVRDPFMSSDEMQRPPADRIDKMTADQQQYYGVSSAYQNRWQAIVDVRSDLETDLLEAEVLWGTELRERFRALYKLQFKLYRAIRDCLMLQNPDVGETTKAAVAKRASMSEDILYDGSPEDEEDAYTKEFSAYIKPIEDYLKPHLRK